MHVFILHHEVLFVRTVGFSPPVYIRKGGSFQMKISFSAVTIKHNEIIAEPDLKVFRLGLQIGPEQEHPSPASWQSKGITNADAKQMPQRCPEKPWDRIIQSGES